jgi:hypothetical protein
VLSAFDLDADSPIRTSVSSKHHLPSRRAFGLEVATAERIELGRKALIFHPEVYLFALSIFPK